MLARKELEGRTAAGLLELAARALLPPMRMTVPEYAERHRFLPNAGGGRGDRWRNDVTPYLVEPMEDLTSRVYSALFVVGPGQVAKTVLAENWLLHSIATDPANVLWYMPTEDMLEAFVKDRINPMIEDHDEINRAQGLRAVDDSLHYKRFRGMSVQFLAATPRNLISKSAPRVVADEIDAYPQKLGDVKVQFDIRVQRHPESMIVALSHCDLAKGLIPEKDWTDGIMAMYADSTRCIWYWPCPHCVGWSSPNPMGVRVMSIEYDTARKPAEIQKGLPPEYTLDEVEASAYLRCPVNGCVVHDKERRGMNRAGVWIGEGQAIDIDGRIRGTRKELKSSGYWIVGAMSPFIKGGIGAMARARVKAERELESTGEDKTLREVIVKMWGIPYTPSRAMGSVSANDLADRAESILKLGEVPDGARFITMAVDAQLAYFEYLARAWGPGGESWIIDRGKILAETSTSVEDWEKLIQLFGKAYPLADGSGRGMNIRAGTFDSGGAPGVTQQAYSAWSRWRKAGRLSLYGQIAGREAWSALPAKGANHVNSARLQIVYPDTSRKASKNARGEIPLALFNPNNFKDDLAGQLMRAEPGPWYIHYPAELRSNKPPHVWFEQAVSERRLVNGRWEKLVPSARNETLDLLVMSHMVAHLHGLTRINWERPPPWAAPWDKNVMVSKLPTPGAGGTTEAPRSHGGAIKIKIDQGEKKSIGSRLA